MILAIAIFGGIGAAGLLLLASFFLDVNDSGVRWPLVIGAVAIASGIAWNSYGFTDRYYLSRRGYKVSRGGPPPTSLAKSVRAAEAGNGENRP